MEELIEFVIIYNVEIIMALMAGFILLLLFTIISQVRIFKIRTKYNQLVRGIEGVNVEELLIKTGEEIHDMDIKINNFEINLKEIETKLAFAIQKVGFVRYDAFAEMGNELSFSIALLDNFKNGFVLTSIYGREHTTSYAKPLKFGKSVYPLSVEETQAIDRALMGEYEEKRI